ncbi:MAG: Fumble domain-containing protein [Candidatus Binatia bacterium]|nr:Fumble domain-containing protein [Candidatus Binatia bacterium]
MDCAAIDFGGSVTDVVLRRGDGSEVLRAEQAVERPTAADVRRLLEGVSAGAVPPTLVAVTGGRSGALTEDVDGIPLVAVDEAAATAVGAVRTGIATPAVVVSLGTGTGIVLARPPKEPERLIGSGVGGGTLIGLARLLLGTENVEEIGALVQKGDPARCDLSVGDIVGQGVGPVRADATAAHFGRLTRSDGSTRPEDVAAALVRLVGQTALRLAIDSVLMHQAVGIVLVGHVLDIPGFRESILSTPGVESSFVHMPADPGFAVAQGALDVALAGRPDLAG